MEENLISSNFSVGLFKEISSGWKEQQSSLKSLSEEETNTLFFNISHNSLLDERTLDLFVQSNLTTVSLETLSTSKFGDLFRPSFKTNTPKARVANIPKECFSKIFQITLLEKIILVK